MIERVTSINFSTNKMLIKENTNFNAEGGDELLIPDVFEDETFEDWTW